MNWTCSGNKKCILICENTGKVVCRKSKSVFNCKNCWFKEMINKKKKIKKVLDSIKISDMLTYLVNKLEI